MHTQLPPNGQGNNKTEICIMMPGFDFMYKEVKKPVVTVMRLLICQLFLKGKRIKDQGDRIKD